MTTANGHALVTRKRVVAALVIVALVALVAWAMRPRPTVVEVGTVVTAPMRVTLDEEGETRVRDRYVVSAPVAGRVLRVDLEPGDRVVAHRTVLVTLRPAGAGLLDVRTRSELQARVAAAQAARNAARVEEDRARVQLAQAERDLARARQLVGAGAVSRERLEEADVAATTLRQATEVARERVRAADADLRLARASLMTPSRDDAGPTITIRAPVDGVVLRRLRESEAVVPQGEPILEIADLSQLEVVADFLSTDAVRIRSGQPALIARWGGSDAIRGHVRLVEPAGFTKVSALGVEEQRVNVVITVDDPHLAATRLGDRFRVEVRVVVWESPDVVSVPIGSLVRDGDGWFVFAIREGRAVRTPVVIGQRNDTHAQVLSGVQPGAQVVAFPGSALADGARVRAQPS